MPHAPSRYRRVQSLKLQAMSLLGGASVADMDSNMRFTNATLAVPLRLMIAGETITAITVILLK